MGQTIELLPEIIRLAGPGTLVTDASSTKRSVCTVAAESFLGKGSHFLGGCPHGGKGSLGNRGGRRGLFRQYQKYALIGQSGEESASHARVADFLGFIHKLGAEPIWLDAGSPDNAAAMVSHLPQLLAVALAGVVRGQTDETGLPVTLAGRGLRDALRLAGSPYSVWRDIIIPTATIWIAYWIKWSRLFREQASRRPPHARA